MLPRYLWVRVAGVGAALRPFLVLSLASRGGPSAGAGSTAEW
jgi:hypothetical protein